MDVSLPPLMPFSGTHDWQTYFGGESFAGQYIPYFGITICHVNDTLLIVDLCLADAVLNSDLNIPLRGAAIGNGWIDGRNQYPAYLEFATTHGNVDVKSQVHLVYHCHLQAYNNGTHERNIETTSFLWISVLPSSTIQLRTQ